ncbi:uncharacterized protein [Linepithema humile]|uniref:uncharacterized protein n=1 Tax=Linepithema humile TaxID=83485 RepID=UPI00351DDE1C
MIGNLQQILFITVGAASLSAVCYKIHAFEVHESVCRYLLQKSSRFEEDSFRNTQSILHRSAHQIFERLMQQKLRADPVQISCRICSPSSDLLQDCCKIRSRSLQDSVSSQHTIRNSDARSSILHQASHEGKSPHHGGTTQASIADVTRPCALAVPIAYESYSAESLAPSTIASETPPQSNVSYPSNIELLHNYNSTQYSNPKQHSNSMHSPQYTNMNTVPTLSGYAPPFPYHHHGSPNNNGQIDDFLKTMLDAIEKVGTAVYAIRDKINERLDGFEKRIFENVDKLRKDLLQQMVDRNAQQPHQSYKPPNGFPLRTLEQLDAFLQNADQIQNLKLYLSSVGGGTVKETLNQFLKETLHEELVTNFTWVRAEGTRSVYNSKMAEIYFDGLVLCNRRVGSREFAQTMQEVLRIAKQRGRDKKRRERFPLGPRQQIEREIEQRYGRGQQIVFQRKNGREDSNEENNNSDSNSEN